MSIPKSKDQHQHAQLNASLDVRIPEGACCLARSTELLEPYLYMYTTPYSEGDPSSRITIVGEAPSYSEMAQGKPFCGPAGHLLDRLLQAAQIPRSSTYITNVFETQIRKPRNDAGKIEAENGTLLWTSGKGFTEAGREASKGCLGRIRQASPNVICPLGGPALHLCVDNRSVSKWRGSILEGNADLAGRKVVATFHPSYALQGAYESRWIIAKDLKRVREESKTSEIRLDQRNLIIDPTYEQAIEYLKRARDSVIVDTDIELLNGNVDCFSLALSPTDAISIPLITENFENRFSPEEEAQIWSLYSQIISSPRITKVNQNIAFDLAMLLQLNNLVPGGPIADCMVAFSVMNPFLKKDLGLISSLYTREPYYKDQGELHDSYKIDDFSRRWRYNALDAAVALESWYGLDKELGQYRPTYDMTMALIPSLIWMMIRGIRVNSEAIAINKRDTKDRIAGLIEKMETAFGRPIYTETPEGKGAAAKKRELAASRAININSPKQLCDYFYNERGFRVLTGGGSGPSVDDVSLSRIVRRDNSLEAKLIQEYRGLNTLLTRYLNVSFDRDQRIRCSWNPRGTWTGRLSSSQTVTNTGGNLQNQPEETRGFMEADDAAIA